MSWRMKYERLASACRTIAEDGQLDLCGHRAQLSRALAEADLNGAGVNGDLPDPGANALGPWSRESDTSREAAINNFPRSGNQRWRVLRALHRRAARGGTRDELAAELNLLDSSTDARVCELLKGGWIVETERTRATASGAQASVLILSDRACRRIERDPEALLVGEA